MFQQNLNAPNLTGSTFIRQGIVDTSGADTINLATQALETGVNLGAEVLTRNKEAEIASQVEDAIGEELDESSMAIAKTFDDKLAAYQQGVRSGSIKQYAFDARVESLYKDMASKYPWMKDRLYKAAAHRSGRDFRGAELKLQWAAEDQQMANLSESQKAAAKTEKDTKENYTKAISQVLGTSEEISAVMFGDRSSQSLKEEFGEVIATQSIIDGALKRQEKELNILKNSNMREDELRKAEQDVTVRAYEQMGKKIPPETQIHVDIMRAITSESEFGNKLKDMGIKDLPTLLQNGNEEVLNSFYNKAMIDLQTAKQNMLAAGVPEDKANSLLSPRENLINMIKDSKDNPLSRQIVKNRAEQATNENKLMLQEDLGDITRGLKDTLPEGDWARVVISTQLFPQNPAAQLSAYNGIADYFQSKNSGEPTVMNTDVAKNLSAGLFKNTPDQAVSTLEEISDNFIVNKNIKDPEAVATTLDGLWKMPKELRTETWNQLSDEAKTNFRGGTEVLAKVDYRALTKSGLQVGVNNNGVVYMVSTKTTMPVGQSRRVVARLNTTYVPLILEMEQLEDTASNRKMITDKLFK